MKRILITGATGFIGSAFAKRHQHKFSSVTGLSRSAAPFGDGLTSTACDLANYHQLENVSKGMDCIVHTAYDQGDLKKNIIGLQNIIRACQQNNVKRLIYLSTFAVYDPYLKGIINENSAYSSHADPYSRIKQRSESLLKKAMPGSAFDAIILQPTIVYGVSGNWTAHAVKSLASGVLYLPGEGNLPCNAVHVDDVADAIYLSIEAKLSDNGKNMPIPRFLISADQPTTWRKFYESHQTLTNTPFFIKNLSISYQYANSLPVEAVYKFLFSRPGFLFLYNLMPLLRKFASKRPAKNASQAAIEAGKKLAAFVPMGMNRLYHSEQFTIDISKAKEQLGYKPARSIESFGGEIGSVK